MSVPVVVLIAVLPAIALMIFIYFQDNHEREPIGLLLGIFGLGILSAAPTMLFEYLSEKILELIFGGLSHVPYQFIYAFFGVAIIEEFFKFLAAYLLTWRNKNFNYKFDGIVYCLFGSMGFAAIENVLYLFTSTNGSANEILSLGVQRGLLAIPCHGMCAIFMGYFYGNAKYLKSFGDRSGCRKNLLIGYLLASSLHAFYDFCLFTQMGIFIVLFIAFVVVADVFTIIMVIRARKTNDKMYIAPQYRQYWVGPAANPYQPYGGYSAPTYGGYTYQTPPVVGQNPTYVPPITGQGNITPGTPQLSQNLQSPNTQFAQNPQSFNTQFTQNPQSSNTQFAQNPQSSNTQFTQNPQDFNPQLSQRSNANQNTQNANPQYSQPLSPYRSRLIKCPVCSATNYFNAFNCTSCGCSLHQL